MVSIFSSVCGILTSRTRGPRLNAVAVGERLFLAYAPAIDQGAVGAAQIANGSHVLGDGEHAMLPADQLAVGADMALRAPAKNELPCGKGQVFSALFSQDDLKLYGHL